MTRTFSQSGQMTHSFDFGSILKVNQAVQNLKIYKRSEMYYARI